MQIDFFLFYILH